MLTTGFLMVLLAAAPPPLEVRPGLEPAQPIAQEARATWERLDALFTLATGKAPRASTAPIRVERVEGLPPWQAGRSRPGELALRQNTPFTFDLGLATVLRHELAHHFLFVACPAAREDALFHEAFALATSGELSAWEEGPYLSLTTAAAQLDSAKTYDSRAARRALARLLAEHPRGQAGLPRAVERRLRVCADDARWTSPLRASELANHADESAGDPGAVVVLSRHSGEVLFSSGEAARSRPFGSTLKPFVVAGATHLPMLRPDPKRPEWVCGSRLPRSVDARLALLRSCNGYFLDWERPRAPFVPHSASWWRSALHRPFHALNPASFGKYGQVLLALGLSRLPERMSEAIGLEAGLELSPVALAQAYRLLAESRPDLLDVLRGNAKEGTLSDLPASPLLEGVALKTGTVRDALSRPRYGWIAAVTSDAVVVMVRSAQMPRQFAGELAGVLEQVRAMPAIDAARVQTFGLLPTEAPEVRCSGTGVRTGKDGPSLLSEGYVPLASTVRTGTLMCLGAPFFVRFEAALMPEGGREYAGLFTHVPLPASRAEGGTLKEQRARRGSTFLFRTTRARYVTGVLASEDAGIKGEARKALARVVDHNGKHGALRHPGRTICDTTHCQVFQGTQRRRTEDESALATGPLPYEGWLPFARGGEEPWEQRRGTPQVDKLLGPGAAGSLRFTRGEAHFIATRQAQSGPYEEAVSLPCERVRGPLKLPSCPDRARLEGEHLVFAGRGAGHGEGLDVEWARGSGKSQAAILEAAYGPERSPD